MSGRNDEASLLPPGTVIGERYQIISFLGSGGMSVVYKAKHTLMDRFVAIKMLRGSHSGDVATLERFQQEARAESCLDHPNIIKVQSLGVTEAGQLYMVMDLLCGHSLADLLAKEGRLDAHAAIAIFDQICAALEHAHERGVIHRDLKPSNVMIDGDGIKLVDFGIAKLLPAEGRSLQQLTAEGSIFGTPAYMSPEQCLAKALDARSDIYSFGCLMFEVLCGRPPFLGDSNFETLFQHLHQSPPSFAQILPGSAISPRLEELVMKALEKRADDRFKSISELGEELQEVARDLRENRVHSRKRRTRKPLRKRTLAGVCAAFSLIIAVAVIAIEPIRHSLIVAFNEPTLKNKIASSDNDPRKCMILKMRLAQLYWSNGRKDLALREYSQVIPEISANPQWLVASTPEIEEGIRAVDRGLQGDSEKVAMTLSAMVSRLLSLNNPSYIQPGVFIATKNLELMHQYENCDGKCLALLDLSKLAAQKNQYESAEGFLQQAAALISDMGPKQRPIFQQMVNFAVVNLLLQKGDFEKAIIACEHLANTTKHPYALKEVRVMLKQIGESAGAKGSFDIAAKSFNIALSMLELEDDSDPGAPASCRHSEKMAFENALGELEYRRQRYKDALPHLTKALDLIPPVSNQERLSLQHMIADCHFELHQYQPAASLYSDELQRLRRTTHPTLTPCIGVTARRLYNALRLTGENAQAETVLSQYLQEISRETEQNSKGRKSSFRFVSITPDRKAPQ